MIFFIMIISLLSCRIYCMDEKFTKSQPITYWRPLLSDLQTNLTYEETNNLRLSNSNQNEYFDFYKDEKDNKYYFCAKNKIYQLNIDQFKLEKKSGENKHAARSIKLSFDPNSIAVDNSRRLLVAAGIKANNHFTCQIISLKNFRRLTLSGYGVTSKSWLLNHGFSAKKENTVVVEFNCTRKEWPLADEDLDFLNQNDSHAKLLSVRIDE